MRGEAEGMKGSRRKGRKEGLAVISLEVLCVHRSQSCCNLHIHFRGNRDIHIYDGVDDRLK